ncbi:hypothetical protein [Flavobacterium sp. GT3R68]|uniref:hypothetical protein n=1 Tax=Flavobacterium sp. GT3R68 TaxID=2594437 RepID=UPI000F885291|nr:hypothetical protein [Flavobacterium sp. GT3R68]RTY89642.1 hypothetical protein EKL32_22200 [Flavobacterium sp. GSN2]TRW89471.1 hypothetical protein FNW07_13310 [Flavobacterium sp. GT3R68]
MALSNFFRINLPYGIKRNSNNEWIAFNREYMPLGWSKISDKFSIHSEEAFSENPVYTKYKALTELKLIDIASSENSIKYDTEGKISMIFLYDDKTNPSSNKDYWKDYFDKIEKLSILIAIN